VHARVLRLASDVVPTDERARRAESAAHSGLGLGHKEGACNRASRVFCAVLLPPFGVRLDSRLCARSGDVELWVRSELQFQKATGGLVASSSF
jgi:hypothetical protein